DLHSFPTRRSSDLDHGGSDHGGSNHKKNGGSSCLESDTVLMYMLSSGTDRSSSAVLKSRTTWASRAIRMRMSCCIRWRTRYSEHSHSVISASSSRILMKRTRVWIPKCCLRKLWI